MTLPAGSSPPYQGAQCRQRVSGHFEAQAGLLISQASLQSPLPCEQVGLRAEIIQKLQDKATVLTTERKKRKKTITDELVRSEDLGKYRQVATHAGLQSTSVPGILSLDLSRNKYHW
ncbi:hypothetical protein UPYG_G00043360 [Umbra pygmaea]|uniref:Pre-mRNA-processing factor 19 n=1 Tax=Umbra pygmaea TaxID=75934 RepID=A0ABD0Y978_UMBPY